MSAPEGEGKPQISKEAAAKLIKSLIPDVDDMLKYYESKGGWVRFSPWFSDAVEKLKISDYPLLYEHENKIVAVGLQAMLDKGELEEFLRETRDLNPEEQAAEVEAIIDELVTWDFDFHIPKTDQEIEEARKAFEQLDEAERTDYIRRWKLFVAFLLAIFYNHISLMVHGQKLTSLVSQAIAGDDDAFALAVQIDRNILAGIPYFKDRNARAQAEGDVNFLDKLSYRLSNPVLRGKIRHRTLWMVFAMLDGLNLLDGTLKHREILDICDAAGVGGYKYRIEDVGYLSKRLREYHKFQGRIKKSRP